MKWVKELPNIVKNQNSSINKTLGDTPDEAVGVEKSYKVIPLEVSRRGPDKSREGESSYNILTALAKKYGIVIGGVPTYAERMARIKEFASESSARFQQTIKTRGLQYLEYFTPAKLAQMLEQVGDIKDKKLLNARREWALEEFNVPKMYHEIGLRVLARAAEEAKARAAAVPDQEGKREVEADDEEEEADEEEEGFEAFILMPKNVKDASHRASQLVGRQETGSSQHRRK